MNIAKEHDFITSNKVFNFLFTQLRHFLAHWRPPVEFVLMGTALFVGITTGLGAVFFRYLIKWVAWVGYDWVPRMVPPFVGKGYVLFVPMIGGALVGWLVYNFAREAKGHGVPEVMEAVALKGGRIRPRVAVVKSLASSLCIGSGGSVGREGPIVQIGSALGSSVGQLLGLDKDRVNNLVACGAAAGIAATFNAPFAGVIFALEIILGRFTVRYFSSVVIASVSASVIGRIAFGNSPAFAIPFKYGVNSYWEYLLYPLFGLLAAVVGVFFTRTLYWFEDLFDDWKSMPEWFKPAIGGILLGVVALAYPMFNLSPQLHWDKTPHIFNVGYDVIELALANKLLLTTVIALLILKILGTVLTLGSGGSGGVFAPSLFIGAMLGAAFALVMNGFFPTLHIAPGAFALVGMAAVFSATAHAPMTAVLILFELTGDYHIILPLMLTVVISTIISQIISKEESIYTLKLSRRGVKLKYGRDVDILQRVLVQEVLTPPTDILSYNSTLADMTDALTHSHHNGFGVLDDKGKLWGIVTLRDLELALEAKLPMDTPISKIATTWPHLKVTFPDETIGDALALMGALGVGRLPVVSREDPYKLLGFLWRKDVIEAYNIARTRRSELENRAKKIQANSKDSAEFIEYFVAPDDVIVGKTISEIRHSNPIECAIVSIERDRHILIPRGDTVFQPNDRITLFVRKEDAEKLFENLHLSLDEVKKRAQESEKSEEKEQNADSSIDGKKVSEAQ